MAFNTRLLPPFAESGSLDPGKVLWGEGEKRARAIADAIRGDPWPDVIAFSEVWTDMGRLAAQDMPLEATLVRDVLVRELAGLYRFATPMAPDPIPLPKVLDSGLLLMSRAPPSELRGQLPTEWETADPRVGFALFGASAGIDALSSKGAGVVRFESGVGFVTIAFTHLQSSYDFIDEHWVQRAQQLDTIEALLTAAVGPQPWPANEQVLVVGDLNIAAIKSPEYNGLFANPNLLWGTKMHDGWATFNSREDPGITQNSWAKADKPELERNRLDYVLAYDPAPPFPPETFAVAGETVEKLVAQHMRTTHRTLSDHYALCADFARWRQFCHPLGAYRWYGGPPFLKFRTRDAEQMVWLRFDAGTYTFTNSDELELAVYAVDDLSDPWPPYEPEVDLSKIAGAEASWHEPRLPPEGAKYSLSTPFLVRAVARGPWHGEAAVGWRRHRGESMLDAIGLRAQDPRTRTDFPPDRKLGASDEQWFSIKPRRAAGGDEQHLEIYLDNPSVEPEPVTLSLRSRTGQQLDRSHGAAPSLRIQRRDRGGETLYVVVERSRVGQDNVFVGWRTSLSFIHPHGLRCVDETGLDIAGADEITLTLAADGVVIDSRGWDDADSGEMLPLIDVSQPAASLGPAAYVERAEIHVVEHDVDGDVEAKLFFAVLGSDAATVEEILPVPLGTGEYSFLFHRSHWLRGD